MLEDDDLLEVSAPRSNRGFWIIAVATLTAGVVMTVAIFANRPLVGTIARSEKSLRDALAQADRIHGDGGTYAQAGTDALSIDGLAFLPGDVPSNGPASVSVYSTASTWAAAVEAKPGACFYIKQVVGRDTTYGSGTVCTGEAALAAIGTAW